MYTGNNVYCQPGCRTHTHSDVHTKTKQNPKTPQHDKTMIETYRSPKQAIKMELQRHPSPENAVSSQNVFFPPNKYKYFKEGTLVYLLKDLREMPR